MAEGEKKFKIGEVCRLASVQPYVLRYWETEFPPLAPGKSGGGQRLYTQREIDIILRIKQLLYDEGFTIAGAKKKLDGELEGDHLVTPEAAPPAKRSRAATETAGAAKSSARDRALLTKIRSDLQEILGILSR